MLRPDDRQLLVDALRPPEGYQLDQAIGTTYSLDLLTLLAIPLNFTLLEWRNEDDGNLPNPLAMLEAIRRFAGKLTVFCQAGQIYVPKQHQLLYSNLEQSIIEVVARKPQHAFHPKVWALRFEASRTSDEDSVPVRYRFIVLSRNITFDRSWDTVLVLDGQLTDRRNAFSGNHPLGDFIQTLPELAVDDVPGRTCETVDQMQYEIRRVEFDLPRDVEEITFWPAGLTIRHTWPFGGRRDRIMVISPFLSGSFLNRFRASEGDVLISRLEAIAQLDINTQHGFAARYVFSDYATPVDEIVTATGARPATPQDPDRGAGEPLEGLHAKVFVADAGWDAHVWAGSANATEAAFSGNVEFMVEMRGRKSRLGIDALLGGESETSLQSLLQPIDPVDPEPGDKLTQQLDNLINEARRSICRAVLRIEVRPSHQENTYQLILQRVGGVPFTLPANISVSSRPITLSPDDQRHVDTTQEEIVRFESVSLEAITPFVAFRIEATQRGQSLKSEFVRNLPLIGAPAERERRILRALFQNQNDVLRYLLMLLAEGEVETGDAFQIASALRTSSGNHSGQLTRIPLFEAMVRALHRNPEKFKEIAQLVEDLADAPDSEELLPQGFEQIWEPIWRASCQDTL